MFSGIVGEVDNFIGCCLPLPSFIRKKVKDSDNESIKEEEQPQSQLSEPPENGAKGDEQITEGKQEITDQSPSIEISPSVNQEVDQALVEAMEPVSQFIAIPPSDLFYELEILLKEGRNLAIRDKSGSSDPYVKFIMNGKQQYKSKTINKNLNPVWDERCTLTINDVNDPITIQVYDYDRGPVSDDFMGSAQFYPSSLQPSVTARKEFPLVDEGSTDELGYLILECTLVPKSKAERERFSPNVGRHSLKHRKRHQHHHQEHSDPELTSEKQAMESAAIDDRHHLQRDTVFEDDFLHQSTESQSLHSSVDDNTYLHPSPENQLLALLHSSKTRKKTASPLRFFRHKAQSWSNEIHALSSPRTVKKLKWQKAITSKSSLSVNEEEEKYDGDGALSSSLYTATQIHASDQRRDSKFLAKKSKQESQRRKMKMQIWSGVVTITLLEGRNLIPMDDNGLSDPYIKFKLGHEKYKSKVENKTLNPHWMEQFDLHLYDDQSNILELSVWDKDVGARDEIMGRSTIDLNELKKEVTHNIEQELEDGAGVVCLLLTISGTSGGEAVSDLSNYKVDPNLRRDLVERYSLRGSLKDIKDVGWLQVKVIRAQNLTSADIGGKSDPFCVLELVNTRLQTQTIYKTLNPDWGKVFTFNVKDIHSVLEITVYDEDKHGSPEFLGKVAVPLLNIKNGERKFYSLKDKKLRARVKGAILLEMEFIFNTVKAAIRTLNPREVKYMELEQKFKISLLQRNVNRTSKLLGHILETGKFINSCFQWESKPRSITAFIAYLIIVWNFELYMLPTAILLIFFWKYLINSITAPFNKNVEEDHKKKNSKGRRAPSPEVSLSEYGDSEEDDDDDDKDKPKKNKEEKKSFREKLAIIEKVCQTIQNKLDEIACLGERLKNTFNFTVPWLSFLLIFILCVATLILYLIPLRILLLAWGINKFTKKLRKPHAINNNELLDFLSRVPSDNELHQYRELRPEGLKGDSAKLKRK
ncbi:multiple C2 and transmembrane domain-containing protein 1-like isoform X4 [Anneissia japonica]|uniref:multiple C2 and transmembrane domain-containing protein 1-like isoform X4 n=1 Tax=Anneissia japonica TaxID=1529436 RepID=UPI0014259E93|nr:multiple C2 and transmembrane domain-containing protein 1-like isoform X4 [Anneissia japonica]